MIALLMATLAIVAVLATSGVAKVRDPLAAASGFDQLRVPDALARPWMRTALPWVEIGLAAALLVLPFPASVLVASLALLLMLAYLVLVARALGSGEEADCNCFGSLTSGRVTRWTLARNVTLTVLAVGALLDALAGDAAIVRVFRPDAVAWLAASVVVAFLGYTILRGDEQALTGIARALRVDGPTGHGDAATPGPTNDEGDDEDAADYRRTPNPPAVLLNPDGSPTTLASLTRERAVLMIWLSFGCGPCSQVSPRIVGWRAALPQIDVRPVVANIGSMAGAPEELRDLLLVDHDGVLSRAVEAFGVPTAVLFGADGMLAGGPVSGPEDIAQFVADITEQLSEAETQSPTDGDPGDPLVIPGEVVEDVAVERVSDSTVDGHAADDAGSGVLVETAPVLEVADDAGVEGLVDHELAPVDDVAGDDEQGGELEHHELHAPEPARGDV